MRHRHGISKDTWRWMIKDITIKLGGTKQAKRQYESVRADIETTFTLPHETAMDTDAWLVLYRQV